MRALFCAAVASADPERLMDRSLIPDRSAGRTVVVGAGKAAASMAQALEACCPGPLSGVVLTPYGHAKTCSGIEVLEAAHPIPDRAGLRTADRILDIAVSLNEGDLMLCLLFADDHIFPCCTGEFLQPFFNELERTAVIPTHVQDKG